MKRTEFLLLAHGAGGRLTHELVRQVFLPAFDNPHLRPLSDAAVLSELPPGRPALTTDAFVVDPLVFPGGDLGYLSVCGTVNDLAVAGARPLWLTWALVLEEGLEGDLLHTIVEGAARACRDARVTLVAGDTKVVPRGKGDRAFAISAGLGVVPPGRDLGDHRVQAGDDIVISGPFGDHGATIMACRHGLSGAALVSDCAPLGDLAEAVLTCGAAIHAMHDPTRGGVATTCHEVAARAGVRVVLEETALPVRSETLTTCEVLGLDPLYLACEGRLLIWVAPGDTDRLLQALRGHPRGVGAARIGHTVSAHGSVRVVLATAIGGERPVDLLAGSELPRIC